MIDKLHTMPVHVDYFWIVLVTFIVTRMGIARGSKYRDTYFTGIKINDEERQVYSNQRNHLIVLASFTIVAIAVIIGIPKSQMEQSQVDVLSDSLFYLSIGMTGSFIGSYLFNIQVNRWGPFIAETLEYVSILAIGFGLYKLLEFVTTDPRIIVIYAAFVFGIVGLAVYDLIFIKKFFHSKKEEKGEEDD